ncbi:MAG: hypothetical protein ACREMZ_00095 [Gemmatimonadales bacterium]
MRNYWMRIAFGALAIFALGMVGVTLARRGISGVRQVAEGTGPITIPVAFVPFKLDGERLGTIRRIKIDRAAPDQVKSVSLTVRLAHSADTARLEGCILVAEGFEDFNSQTTIRCATPAETTYRDLANIGEVRLTPGGRFFDLLMPREAIRELTDSDSLFVGRDTIWPDSVAEAARRMADSVQAR